jgi:ectoine hydroxylase-related dioxygenase (phytanoyl-CoA dioxygenase family)
MASSVAGEDNVTSATLPMLALTTMKYLVERDGFTIVPHVIGARQIARLIASLAAVESGGLRRRDELYAVRHLLETVPEVQTVAHTPMVRALVEPLLGAHCFVVRSLLLDKTPTANWKVAWHQDLSIAVRARANVPGFGAWSEKAGVPHVQPPAEILARMLTVRLYLDPCDETNGPLNVLPGSHSAGRLSGGDIKRWREHNAPVTCLVPRGGALVMRPLLLHASSAAVAPAHRRVIQLEFAAEELPAGLKWFSRRAA